MNCSEVRELLSAYYDGELADEQHSGLSKHLDECSDCTRELAGFEKLAKMASTLDTPVPSEHIWSQLQRQLDQQPSDGQTVPKPADQIRRRSFSALKTLALAATVLVAVGLGWFAYQSRIVHSEHDHFDVAFGHYLEIFRHDPDAAQQMLLAKYENQLVGPDQAIEQVGYRPAVADGLPAGYTLASTHVMKMPCCTCTQTICKRRDGSTLAIFEHDDSRCDETHCCLIELDDPIAASWKRGPRHITLIGVRDDAEVSEMIARLNEKMQEL